MKCRIEFELPDKGTIFETVKVESVKWSVWGYNGLAKVLPQGEWIKDNLGTVICSECKRPRRDNRVNHINFCNSCGARMKGADDE